MDRKTPLGTSRDTAGPAEGTDPDLAFAELLPGATPPGATPAVPRDPSASHCETQPFPPARSLVGQTLDDFELIQELGRGGMGVVYKARQLSLERWVAVKTLLAEHVQNPVVLARFLTEARTAASLDHANIVKVFQVGEHALGHFFVMEFVDGPALEKLIRRGPLPVPAAVAISIRVAEAVHYAHGRGIIHRDLKPANIMIDQSKRPVVMDFGIAKSVSKSSGLTQQGAILGTPGYMPPEQAGEEHAKVGPYSDVYSLGAILYSMLSGRPPFEEGTALKTILKVVSPDPPAPVRSFRKEVPPQLEQICMKCLQKRPDDRYPTARALADELRRFRAGGSHPAASPGLSGSSAPAARPAPPTPVEEPAEEPVRYLLLNLATKKPIKLRNGTYIIGRASDCDIIVRASDVSKRHCQLFIDDDGAEVEDLSSSNGTFVNDRRITRAPLRPGDKLDLGGHLFQLRLPGGKT